MITIVGGTGRLGRLVAARLVQDGHEVRVAARHAPGAAVPGAEFVVADVRSPSTLEQAVAGASVVVSAMHGFDPAAGESPASVDRDGNRALIRAARAVGADVVLVSIIGAAADSPIELCRMKADAEVALRDTGGHPADWTIVRAASFAELWLDLFRSTAGRSGVPKVMGPGRNPINFVSVADVAVAVARAASDSSLRGRVIEVAGEDSTMTDMAMLAAPGRIPTHLPTPVVGALAIVLRPVRPGMARVFSQALAMERTPLASDPSRTHAEYPWLPLTTLGEVADGQRKEWAG